MQIRRYSFYLVVVSALFLTANHGASAQNLRDVIRDFRDALKHHRHDEPRDRMIEPSFNCDDARKADEVAICANQDLAALDSAAVAGFDYVRRTQGGDIARQLNLSLFKERQACKADVNCIRKVQLTAIDVFHSRGASVSASLWELEGTPLVLVANGKTRMLVYSAPEGGKQRGSDQSGPPLFEGVLIDHQYRGTAYLRQSRCGEIEFPAVGTIAPGYDRISLRGSAPRLNSDCRRVGSQEILLELNLIQANATANGDKTAPSVPSPHTAEKPNVSADRPALQISEQPKMDADKSALPAGNNRANADATPPVPAKPRCDNLVIAKPFFIAACVMRGMQLARNQGFLAAKEKADRERQNLKDCEPASVTKIQQLAELSSARILNSGSISSLMDFSDAMNLECGKAVNSIIPAK